MGDLTMSFSKLFVPSEILEHFDVVSLKEEGGVMIIELFEKADAHHIPEAILREGKAVLDGYCNKQEIQTYPAQGKEVFLRLFRRKWKVKGTTKSYSNSYEFTKSGMKATKDFGAFLKEIGRG
jgi:hypothetical protein